MDRCRKQPTVSDYAGTRWWIDTCLRTLVDEIILRYGTPERVINDNGSLFVGEVMLAVSYCLGFHPVDRNNRDIETQLAILTTQSHTAWKDRLPSIQFALNSTVSAATEELLRRFRSI
uniref:Integrase catalytic domain-containing protein n=1 Tax=Photinus pyralis TaxID=7054 RepID=A0A1Y1MWN1_PHOPY